MNTRELFRKYTDEESFSKIVEMPSVSVMWERCVKEYGDKIAVSLLGKEYSFNKLNEDVSRFRTLLLNANLIKGDRIGILCKNSYEFVKVFLSCVTTGITATVLPAHLDEKTVFGCTLKFNLKGIIYGDDLAEKTSVAKSQNPSLLFINANETSNALTPCADLSEDDEAVIMFTGGTTGKSKGALLTQGALMQGTVNGCYGTKDVFFQKYLLVLPLSHVFGLIRNLMTSLYTGSNLYICENNKDMFRDIAVFRPTIFVVVPAICEMALKLSRTFKKNMLGEDMKTVICGAATVNPYLIEEYNKMGITLLPGYGLTESANLVSGNPENLAKPSSVGIPYPNQELKVVDGELWIKGKNMMKGYVGESEENTLAYEDGYFKTGDLVKFDDDGFLYIVGRIKEIIVLPTGENISPAELEAKFNSLSIVSDSQVFEDEENGNRFLSLEVVLRAEELAKLNVNDAKAYAIGELEKINATLPSFERVSKIVIRDTDFARTPSMKIVRYKKCN